MPPPRGSEPLLILTVACSVRTSVPLYTFPYDGGRSIRCCPAVQEFRQCVAERAKLEEEVAQQHQLILDMRQKTASDKAVIEELKLQVRVVHILSRSPRLLVVERNAERDFYRQAWAGRPAKFEPQFTPSMS